MSLDAAALAVLLDQPGRHRLGAPSRLRIALSGAHNAALNQEIESPRKAARITQPRTSCTGGENCTDPVQLCRTRFADASVTADFE